VRQATSGAGAAATITLPAGTASQVRCLRGVTWSYSAAPTGGRLTIASSGGVTFDVDTPATGLNVLDLTDVYRGMPGQTVVVTLAGGGGAVVGKLNVLVDWLE